MVHLDSHYTRPHGSGSAWKETHPDLGGKNAEVKPVLVPKE